MRIIANKRDPQHAFSRDHQHNTAIWRLKFRNFAKKKRTNSARPFYYSPARLFGTCVARRAFKTTVVAGRGLSDQDGIQSSISVWHRAIPRVAKGSVSGGRRTHKHTQWGCINWLITIFGSENYTSVGWLAGSDLRWDDVRIWDLLPLLCSTKRRSRPKPWRSNGS